jgi:hypothetical protein
MLEIGHLRARVSRAHVAQALVPAAVALLPPQATDHSAYMQWHIYKDDIKKRPKSIYKVSCLAVREGISAPVVDRGRFLSYALCF